MVLTISMVSATISIASANSPIMSHACVPMMPKDAADAAGGYDFVPTNRVVVAYANGVCDGVVSSLCHLFTLSVQLKQCKCGLHSQPQPTTFASSFNPTSPTSL